jgi:hypothetical protein
MFISGETNLASSPTSDASLLLDIYYVGNDDSSPTSRLTSPLAINTYFGNIVIFIRPDRLFQVLGSFT